MKYLVILHPKCHTIRKLKGRDTTEPVHIAFIYFIIYSSSERINAENDAMQYAQIEVKQIKFIISSLFSRLFIFGAHDFAIFLFLSRFFLNNLMVAQSKIAQHIHTRCA